MMSFKYKIVNLLLTYNINKSMFFYVLGIKPNAWTYISGIKLKF